MFYKILSLRTRFLFSNALQSLVPLVIYSKAGKFFGIFAERGVETETTKQFKIIKHVNSIMFEYLVA